MEIDLKRQDGGYMSVDAAAAIEKNREIIDKIRELWERRTGQKAEPRDDAEDGDEK
jgi:hypothetical protein